MAIDDDWLDARETATKALIVAYEGALTALATGAQSYTLDTGQSRQVVTKADIASMRLFLDMLENRLATICARRDGAGHVGRMFGR